MRELERIKKFIADEATWDTEFPNPHDVGHYCWVLEARLTASPMLWRIINVTGEPGSYEVRMVRCESEDGHTRVFSQERETHTLFKVLHVPLYRREIIDSKRTKQWVR